MRNPRNDRLAAEKNSASPEHGESHAPERTCVLTRRKGDRGRLIRLALSPDGEVAPDVRARAPGRGAWISVGRGELEQAVSSGKLKSALQRAFKAGEVTVPADLAERTAAALRQAGVCAGSVIWAGS